MGENIVSSHRTALRWNRNASLKSQCRLISSFTVTTSSPSSPLVCSFVSCIMTFSGFSPISVTCRIGLQSWKSQRNSQHDLPSIHDISTIRSTTLTFTVVSTEMITRRCPSDVMHPLIMSLTNCIMTHQRMVSGHKRMVFWIPFFVFLPFSSHHTAMITLWFQRSSQ